MRDHYGIMYLNDDRVFFTTNALTKSGDKKKYKDTYLLKLYEAEINAETQELDSIKEVDLKLKRSYFNASIPAFTRDGNSILVTVNFQTNKNSGDTYKSNIYLKILQGEYIEGKGFSNFKELPFCSDNYSYAQPAISPNAGYLFFVSNRKGTKGSTDLYRCTIKADGSGVGSPEPLPEEINTRAREIFPFVSKDGYLYFSKRDKNGIGRLDIYRTKILGGDNYGPPELLPEPINSPYDDYGFIIDSKTNTGYFSSNRKGGKGGADLYYFEIPQGTKL